MSDAVTTTVTADGPRNYTVHLTNISDGTGESAVKKVDISATNVGPNLQDVATSFAIKDITWNVQGMDYVDILWDATTPVVAFICGAGNGFDDFGGTKLNDPKATGTTGDIKLTTSGAVSGGSYDITLNLVKKQ